MTGAEFVTEDTGRKLEEVDVSAEIREHLVNRLFSVSLCDQCGAKSKENERLVDAIFSLVSSRDRRILPFSFHVSVFVRVCVRVRVNI